MVVIVQLGEEVFAAELIRMPDDEDVEDGRGYGHSVNSSSKRTIRHTWHHGQLRLFTISPVVEPVAGSISSRRVTASTTH